MHARYKTPRNVMAMALASTAMFAAGPTLAHPDHSDAAGADASEIIYVDQPVIQGVTPTVLADPAVVSGPLEQPGGPVVISESQVTDVEYEVERREILRTEERDHALAPMNLPEAHHRDRHSPIAHREVEHRQMEHGMGPGHGAGAPVYFPHAGYPAGAMPYPGQSAHGQIGRNDWLEECRARYDSRDGRGSLDECEAYLVQHETQWRHTTVGHGPVMLVPIMVPVEQRAVVREYVTEEWTEEEVMVKVPGKAAIKRAPASKSVKIVPVKRAPTKTKSVKGT